VDWINLTQVRVQWRVSIKGDGHLHQVTTIVLMKNLMLACSLQRCFL